MADFEYGAAVNTGSPVRGSEVVAIMNWMGALISVALIAGLAFWGYRLMVRDVSGVPVVQALQGPMRIAPENPGGLNAEHQGLSVNKIAAEGQAQAPADRLILAPAPLKLTDQDQTAGEIAADNASMERYAAAVAQADATDLAVAEALTGSAEAGEPLAPETAELIAAALETIQNVPPASVQNETQAASVGQIPVEAIATSIAGVSRSPRPTARPATRVASLGSETLVSGGNTAVQSVDPASIPKGTRLAQLGAFESPEIAKAEWAKIAGQFSDVMGGKLQVIQKAESGGKSFYRLRVMGFEDISDARRFCSTLLAGQSACIPVVTR